MDTPDPLLLNALEQIYKVLSLKNTGIYCDNGIFGYKTHSCKKLLAFFFFFFVGSFPERLFWLFCFSPVWYPLFSVKGTLTKK